MAHHEDGLFAEPVRIALVGFGMRGTEYAKLLSDADIDAQLVAIVDTDEAARERARHDYHGLIPVFNDIHCMLDCLDDVSPSAVIVATPPISHAPLSIAALDRGLHVLCEKPVAVNRPGLHMLVDAASRNDRKLVMSSPFRHSVAIERAKELIDRGDLGELVLFRGTFTRRVDQHGKLMSAPEISGGGVIIDQGTHAVDVARSLVGPLRHIVGVETRRVQKLRVEDSAQVLVRTDAGATGTLDLSWSIESDSPWFFTVDGTRGSVRLGWDVSEFDLGDGWQPLGPGHDAALALRRQVDDFARCVRYDKQPLVSQADAQASVAAIDATYRSLQTGTWMRILEERRLDTR